MFPSKIGTQPSDGFCVGGRVGGCGGVALFGRRMKDDCVDVTVLLQEISNLVIADTKVKQASLGIQGNIFFFTQAIAKTAAT